MYWYNKGKTSLEAAREELEAVKARERELMEEVCVCGGGGLGTLWDSKWHAEMSNE